MRGVHTRALKGRCAGCTYQGLEGQVCGVYEVEDGQLVRRVFLQGQQHLKQAVRLNLWEGDRGTLSLWLLNFICNTFFSKFR